MVYAEPLYIEFESVNTIATEQAIELVTNTAGTTVPSFEPETTLSIEPVKEIKPTYANPRLIAREGESQEVIDAILNVFPNDPIMVEVARCESNLIPTADRESRGVDVGLFQLNQVHLPRLNELGLDRLDLDDNLEYSRMLFESSGLSSWYMSEHCWGKYS